VSEDCSRRGVNQGEDKKKGAGVVLTKKKSLPKIKNFLGKEGRGKYKKKMSQEETTVSAKKKVPPIN